MASALQLALNNDAYSHLLLVIPISLTLIYYEKDAVLPAPFKKYWGAILVGVALLLRGLSGLQLLHLSSSSALTLSMGALVIFWIGSAVSCFGIRMLGRFLFPLCFLFLIVPLPDRALNGVTEFLQQRSSLGADILFRAVGVPVVRDGVLLSIPGLDIEVAKECSSVRSSAMLIVITLVLAHLFLHTWTRKLLLVVAAIPLAVAKNAVRIFTIAELGTRVDRGFLHGKLHHHGGVVFLGIGVLEVVVLLWALRKSEGQSVAKKSGEDQAQLGVANPAERVRVQL